jgi:hypothetical protein
MIAKSISIGRLGQETLRRLVIGAGGLVVVGCFAIAYALSTATL